MKKNLKHVEKCNDIKKFEQFVKDFSYVCALIRVQEIFKIDKITIKT